MSGYRILILPDGTATRYYVGSVYIDWETGKRTWIPPNDGMGWITDPAEPPAPTPLTPSIPDQR